MPQALLFVSPRIFSTHNAMTSERLASAPSGTYCYGYGATSMFAGNIAGKTLTISQYKEHPVIQSGDYGHSGLLVHSNHSDFVCMPCIDKYDMRQKQGHKEKEKK